MDGYTEMRASACQKDGESASLNFVAATAVYASHRTHGIDQSVVMSPILSGIKIQYLGPVNSLEANACNCEHVTYLPLPKTP